MNWKKNRLWIAGLALIALVIAAGSALRARESSTDTADPEATLPALPRDTLRSLRIERPGKDPVELSRGGSDDAWKVTAPLQAAADASAVESAVEKLSTLKATGIAATRSANHARLEVDAAQAITVVLGQQDSEPVTLRVGASKLGGTMLRVGDGEAVLKVSGGLRYALDKDLRMWRDRNILDLDIPAVRALSLEDGDRSLRFERSDAGWKQAEGEQAIEGFDPGKVEGLVSTLAKLKAADFAAPDAPPSDTGLDAPLVTVTLSHGEGESAGEEKLLLGKTASEGGQSFLSRVGHPVVYRVARYNAERMQPDPEKFVESEEPAAGAAPPSPGLGGPGQPSLPPEVMRQLQQQLGKGAP